MINITRQKGATLIWAMVVLTVLTILAVGGMRATQLANRGAGNALHSMMVFEGAEGSLVQAKKLGYLEKLAGTETTYEVPQDFTQQVNANNSALRTTVTIEKEQRIACPVTNVAQSSDASQSGSQVSCLLFNIRATTKLDTTNARAEHNIGVVRYVPKKY